MLVYLFYIWSEERYDMIWYFSDWIKDVEIYVVFIKKNYKIIFISYGLIYGFCGYYLFMN